MQLIPKGEVIVFSMDAERVKDGLVVANNGAWMHEYLQLAHSAITIFSEQWV